MDYQKSYLLLFNAMTDALEQMEQQNFGLAAETLRRVQIQSEEWCMEEEQ